MLTGLYVSSFFQLCRNTIGTLVFANSSDTKTNQTCFANSSRLVLVQTQNILQNQKCADPLSMTSVIRDTEGAPLPPALATGVTAGAVAGAFGADMTWASVTARKTPNKLPNLPNTSMDPGKLSVCVTQGKHGIQLAPMNFKIEQFCGRVANIAWDGRPKLPRVRAKPDQVMSFSHRCREPNPTRDKQR